MTPPSRNFLDQEHMQRVQRQQADLATVRFPDLNQIYASSAPAPPFSSARPDADPPHAAMQGMPAPPSSHTSLYPPLKSAPKDPNPSLSRNQACRTCRSRKVRCDAVKPGCGACRKTAGVQGRNPDDVVCEYDDEVVGSTRKRKQPDTTARPSRNSDGPAVTRRPNGNEVGSELKRSRNGPGNKLAQLEKTIADLQNELHHSRGTVDPGWPSDNTGLSGSRSGSISPPHPQVLPPMPYPDATQRPLHGGGAAIDWAAVAAASSISAPMNSAGPRSSSFPFNYPADPLFLPQRNGELSNHAMPLPAPPLQPSSRPNDSFKMRDDSGRFDYAADNISPVIRSTGNSRPNTSPSGNAAPMPFNVSPELTTGLQSQTSLQNGALSNIPTASFSLGAASLPATAPSITPGAGRTMYTETAPASVVSMQPAQFPQPANNIDTLQPGTAVADSDFYGIFFPNWPPTLPSPRLVYQLCDVYFSKRHTTEDLVNKQKFFAHLALQPSHRDFPHTALIHAMCAVATRFIKQDAFDLDKETYWRSAPSPTDYHANAAKNHVDNAIVKGEKLFNVAQAIILICFYFYTSARFVEVWLYCGLATRICSPLGLNHLESLIKETPNSNFPGMPGLPDDAAAFRNPKDQPSHIPQTEEDKAEQAHVFWTAFTADRLATACTGWASSLAEEEVSTLLPKPDPGAGPVQTATAAEMEQLSLSSPTFFTANSLPLINASNLHYKSVILLGRVCAFLRSEFSSEDRIDSV